MMCVIVWDYVPLNQYIGAATPIRNRSKIVKPEKPTGAKAGGEQGHVWALSFGP